jgi:hypothetical protein
MALQLRTATFGRLPRPTREFRGRAWAVFTAALDRHVAAKRDLKPAAPRR